MHRRRALHFHRFLCLLLCALLACASSPKPKPEAALAAEQKQVVTPGLFLYEVKGPRGLVHLLGTIHVGFGFEEVLTDDARVRFHSAARVMTEADVGKTDPQLLVRAALLPQDQSLRKLVGEVEWARLVARLSPQLPEMLLDRLEPWLPAVMLGLAELEQVLRELKPGAENRLMDVELVRLAGIEQKPVTHFETVEEQIAIFDTIPMADQVRELVHTLEQASSEQARQLYTTFSAGDVQGLTEALFDEAQLEGARGFYDRVLYQRNERWLPIIERELERGGAFIAVGAAHLLGDRGLLAALAHRGYQVRRVGAEPIEVPKREPRIVRATTAPAAE